MVSAASDTTRSSLSVFNARASAPASSTILDAASDGALPMARGGWLPPPLDLFGDAIVASNEASKVCGCSLACQSRSPSRA